MDDLADSLGSIAAAYIDLPVVNLTELKGVYDFTLEWARGAAARSGDARRGPRQAGAAMRPRLRILTDPMCSCLWRANWG